MGVVWVLWHTQFSTSLFLFGENIHVTLFFSALSLPSDHFVKITERIIFNHDTSRQMPVVVLVHTQSFIMSFLVTPNYLFSIFIYSQIPEPLDFSVSSYSCQHQRVGIPFVAGKVRIFFSQKSEVFSLLTVQKLKKNFLQFGKLNIKTNHII